MTISSAILLNTNTIIGHLLSLFLRLELAERIRIKLSRPWDILILTELKPKGSKGAFGSYGMILLLFQ